MRKALKLIAKASLFTLMLAVILRPVVVEASTGGQNPESKFSLNTSVHLSQQIFLQKFENYSSNSAKLRVIPKETVNFDGLIPRFVEWNSSSNESCCSTTCLPQNGNSYSRFLVLRI
jgi:hypothetical protein